MLKMLPITEGTSNCQRGELCDIHIIFFLMCTLRQSETTNQEIGYVSKRTKIGDNIYIWNSLVYNKTVALRNNFLVENVAV